MHTLGQLRNDVRPRVRAVSGHPQATLVLVGGVEEQYRKLLTAVLDEIDDPDSISPETPLGPRGQEEYGRLIPLLEEAERALGVGV